MSSRWIVRSAALYLAFAALAPAQQPPSAFTFSYVLAADKNQVPLKPGDSIVFPRTQLNGLSQALLNITNSSGNAAIINGVSVSGGAFALQGLPLFPITVNAGFTLQVLITYTPSGAATDGGQIQISFPQAAAATFNLQGTLSAAKIVYNVVQGGLTTTITPGTTVPMPDTNVGSTSSAIIQVSNAGNAPTTVNAIVINGQDFQLNNVPVLPQIVQPSKSFSFTVTFSPTVAATEQASLSIGTDSFTFTGKGLGPKLIFSYAGGGATVMLGANDSVVFSPVEVTQTGQLTFIVQNTGTVTATMFNIGVGESNSPFSISGLPVLPLQLGPGAQSSFNIVFAPTTVGFVNGTLRLGTTTIGLIGSGTAPPALPAYSIQGPSGNVDPLTQPRVRLKLSKAYPVTIEGTLSLTTAGSLPGDPSVQFLTGGRSVSFQIPKNGTDANFAGQGPAIQLQTGSVASTITLTPSFATHEGIDLTPNTPATLQFTVAPAAPTLTAISVGSQTTTSFVLTVTGFSTTRSLTGMTVQFTGAAGFNVPSTAVSIDLQQAAAAWFASTASVTFGGQFTVSVPFTLHGKVPSTQTLIQSIASVTASVANNTGTSNTLETIVQ